MRQVIRHRRQSRESHPDSRFDWSCLPDMQHQVFFPPCPCEASGGSYRYLIPYHFLTGFCYVLIDSLLVATFVPTGSGISPKSYTCTVETCLKTYSSSGGYNYHMATAHPSDGERHAFHCVHEGCNKSFVSRNGLAYHLSTHSPVRIHTYRCGKLNCNREFSSYSGRSYHEKRCPGYDTPQPPQLISMPPSQASPLQAAHVLAGAATVPTNSGASSIALLQATAHAVLASEVTNSVDEPSSVAVVSALDIDKGDA
jgi:hypothetical protein